MKPHTIQRATKSKDNPYRLISRLAMEDDRLTFEARGVLAYILVKPDDWKIQINDLRRAGNMGRDKVYRILTELITFGYITREADRQASGIIKEMVYYVYENPQMPESITPEEPVSTQPLPEKPDTAEPDTAEPDTAEPDTAEPDTAEPDTENTDSNNKEESSTNKEEGTNKEGGEISATVPAESVPSTDPQPLPPVPLATPLIALAEKVAEAETYDGPAPRAAPNTYVDNALKPTKAKPAKPKPPVPDSPHYTGREFVNGRIPAGEGKNAVQVYYERHSINSDKTRLDAPLEDDMKHITDLDRWRDVVKAWHQAGYNPTGVGGMLDWYRDGIPARGGKPANYGGKPATKGQVTNGVTKQPDPLPATADNWLSRFQSGKARV